MGHESTEVAVLGQGAAGVAATQELVQRGLQVKALDRGDGRGATWSNQRWKHSGLLSVVRGSPRASDERR
jgi:cation diffusion facilitator CzcD-associated flavoprotein CzcO